ncbi:lysophosphatidic acid receptor 4-like [Scomber japonicus]|uniref:lysophosphatidic acid receptor 4-like n=1 Tax=Scomber japonicus TaxID=13676 RepID=UPI00230635A0|nr:lysophosphatidic acid receptor 4-like [Scomber japonicus]
MNNSVNTTEPQLGYAVVFGCVMVLGLPLNAVALWILLRRHSLKSPNAVFMVNLAISDLLLVISLPMRVYFYATGTWPLSFTACTWITMLFVNNIRSSSIFITFIGIDRLLAVVYPLRTRHLRTTSNACKSAVFIWISVIVMNIPERIIFSSRNKNESTPTCFQFDNHSRQHSLKGLVYLQPVLVFILLTINIVSTALVSWTLRRHLTDSARINKKMNVMLIFAMNLVMFTICFVPVSIGVLNRKPEFPYLIWLASVNCCLDPLLYYFSLDSFWKKKEDADSGSVQREQNLSTSTPGAQQLTIPLT